MLSSRCQGADIYVAYAIVGGGNAEHHTSELQMRLWLDPVENVSLEGVDLASDCVPFVYAAISRMSHTKSRQWNLSQDCSYIQQIPDKDLGQRMARAIDQILDSGAQKVSLLLLLLRVPG